MPQEKTDKTIDPIATDPTNEGKKVRPFDKVWITWTMGELAGQSTEEHPALAEKMIAAGKATEIKKGGAK